MRALEPQTTSIVMKIAGMGIIIFIGFQCGAAIVRQDSRKIGLIVMVFFLLIATVRPKVLLYLFLVAYTWFYNEFWYTENPLLHIGANVYVGDVFAFLFLSSTTILTVAHMGHIGLRSGVGVAIAIYLAWAAICIMKGIPVWGHSAIGESRFIMWACVYFPVAHSIRNMKQFQKFLKVFLFLILSYIIYLQIWRFLVQFKGDLGLMFQARLMGPDLALFVTSVFVFCVTFLLEGAVKKGKTTVFLLAVFCAAFIPFGARTGWIAYFISTLFVVFITLRGKAPKKCIIFLLFVAALASLAAYFDLFAQGGRMDLNSEAGLGFLKPQAMQTGTSGWRLGGWAQLLDHTLHRNPILGEGFGGYYDVFDTAEFKGVPPHNDWLIIFSKMGLIGIIMFLTIVIQFYRTGLRYIKQSNDKIKQAHMKGLLAVFLVGLVGGTFFFFFPFMWIAAGLQTALVNASVNDLLKMKMRKSPWNQKSISPNSRLLHGPSIKFNS